MDAKAILFNLTRCKSFACQYPFLAIKCHENNGPCFGNGELGIYYDKFNEEFACYSWVYEDSFFIPLNYNVVNDLTNKTFIFIGEPLSRFTISELEVWGVTLNKIEPPKTQ
jgi:hypothetical protein